MVRFLNHQIAINLSEKIRDENISSLIKKELFI